jgi:hypothetical protein
MAVQQTTLDQKTLEHFKEAFVVNKHSFTPLPTQLSYTEYSFDPDKKELKVHIWLLPEVNMRLYWQELAESFGADALKFTKDVEMYWPPQNITLKDSVFIGMRTNPSQAQNVLTRLLDVDRRFFDENVKRKS